MHTAEWSFTAGYCKLKTARQKKRLQKKDYDKQLIRLDRRQDDLYLKRKDLPWIPLDEPYQKGWKRTFVLREDVAASNRAGFYETLLQKINTVQYATDKAFKRKRRRKRKRVYEVRPQDLRTFTCWEWKHPRYGLTPEERACFYPKEYLLKDGKTEIRYCYAAPWRFVLQVSPHMITHKKLVDEVLEQEIQQLDNYITDRHLRPAMCRLMHGFVYDYRRETENQRQKNPLKNKPLYQILEEADNDLL